MSQVLSKVFQSLNIAVFKRVDPQTFQLLSQPPVWLGQFFEKALAEGESVQFNNIFPFLDCFLDEAEEFWESQVSTPHRSGPWVDYTPDAEEIPLEAIALWRDEQPLLIIQDLGEEYYNEVVRLQGYRDNAFSQELLHLEASKRTKQNKTREAQIATTLLNAVRHSDYETPAHAQRIGLYAEVMAKALNWDETTTADIRAAAPMHDIGNVGIPNQILQKPTAFDDDEFEIMKQHAKIGADLLGETDIPLLQMASEIALHHHEKWDGTGYPNGLAGEAIPESARITAIVDVYDALTHQRAYRPAKCETEALDVMSSMVGKHFDPTLFEVFLENLPNIHQIKDTHTESIAKKTTAVMPKSLAPS
ncbi:MAG: HD-GYP domain-containing protein [Leucothrix sp.]